MQATEAKKIIKNADTIIAHINKGLSQNSYGAVKNGKIKVPIDKFGIISSDVRRLVINHFAGDYANVKIVMDNCIQTIQMDALSD